MIRGSIFTYDFNNAQKYFPKLKIEWISKFLAWKVEGDLDICDEEGNCWGSFNILIKVPLSYPHCVPVVHELSLHINREPDWHMAKDGSCCLDIEHNLLYWEFKGINILDFIRKWVYPYFANQLYRMRFGKYAGQEYQHNFNGVRQFYAQSLSIDSDMLAVKILEYVISDNLPNEDSLCICNSSTYGMCHKGSVDFLRVLPPYRLKCDLNNFRSNLN